MGDISADVKLEPRELAKALATENLKLRDALNRFIGLAEAVDDSMPDTVIIRCEVTAGDIRALMKAVS